MEENKAENKGMKKHLKWIIPVVAVLVAGGAALGVMLFKNAGKPAAIGAPDAAAIAKLSEDAQEMYAALLADGSDTVELEGEVKVSPIIYVNGEKTLSGGSIMSDGGGEYIIVINEGARLTLDGTVIDGNSVSPNGIYVSPDAEFAIKSGSLVNLTGHGIRVLGKAMVSGGKLENAGTNWLMVDDIGTAVVTGGEFTNAGEIGFITAAGSNTHISDAVLNTSAGNLIYNGGTMEICGGSYTGAGDYAIFNAGSLTVTETEFTGAQNLGYIDNDAAGSVEIIGGGMSDSLADFIYNKGTMTVSGTAFSASRSTAIENRGGSSILNISDATFDEIGKNVILNKQGTVYAKNVSVGECGGIAFHNRGADFFGNNITVEKSGGIAFMQDFAADGDTSGAKTFEVDGFEIGFADDYGIRINGGDVVLSNGTVGKCTSYGLYVKNGNVTTNSCTFLGTTDTERNTVQIGLSGTREAVVIMNDTNVTGGARGITNHANLTFNSGRIYGNNCYGSVKVGGGINNDEKLVINGGTIENNYAISSGGGIYNSGECIINGGTIKNNRTDASGGGIAGKGKTIVNEGSICSNRAANYGGGIYCSGELEFIGGQVFGNYSYKGGGGIDIVGVATLSGGTVHDNTCNGPGGGVYTGGEGETLISGITIEKNKSSEKGGGGVYNLGWTRIEGKTLIQNNTAETYGGGVSNSKSTDGEKVGFMIMAGGTVTENNSTKNGGGVSNTGYLLFEGGLVSGNKTKAYGGGMYNSNDLFLSGGEIKGNKSVNGGGGLENTGYAEITGGKITGNESESYGGGLYNGNDANTVLSGGTISGNTSSKGGGGAYNAGAGHLKMTGGTITGNKVKNDSNGAGVYSSGDFGMTGGSVEGNNIGSEGKPHDFYVYKGETRIYDNAMIGTICRASTGTVTVGTTNTANKNIADGEIYLYLSKYEEGVQAINGLDGNPDYIFANRDKFILPPAATGLFINATEVPDKNPGALVSGAGMVQNVDTGVVGSFATMLNSAVPGQTLKFLGEISLSTKQAIGKSITIDGNGNSLVLSANGGLAVNSGAVVTIESMTISSGGEQINAPAVENSGNLTLNDVIFKNVMAEYNGAAIRNAAGAVLTANGGSVTGCTNSKDGGYGVIHNSGTATFSGTSFSGNTAGSGGAIYNTLAAELHLRDCTFGDNHASTGRDLYLNGTVYFAGSITSESAYLRTDKIILESAVTGAVRMNVSGAYDGQTVLAGNTSDVAASCGCFKIANKSPYYELRSDGKIYELTGEVMLTVSEDEVYFGSLAEMAAKAVSGSTLKLLAPVTTVSDVTVPSGVVLDMDGNTLTISSGTTAGFTGVTIKSDVKFSSFSLYNGGTLSLEGCTLTGLNSAKNGGAVYNEEKCTLTMNGGSITGCVSGGSEGGGAIFNKGSANLSGVAISSCSASNNGGAVYTNSSGNTSLVNCSISGCGGKSGGALYLSASTSVVSLNGTVVSGNKTTSNDGNGGGVYSKGALTVIDSSITGNSLKNSGKYGPDFYNYGGTFNVGGYVTIEKSQLAVVSSVLSKLTVIQQLTGGNIGIKIGSGSFVAGTQIAVCSDAAMLEASVPYITMINGSSLVVGPDGRLTAAS